MATFRHRMGNFTFDYVTLTNSAKWSHLRIFGKGITNQNILGSRFHARKKFIGTLGDAPDAADRVAGSVAVALEGAAQGVQILRVHDMKDTKQALRLAGAIRGERW